MYWQFYDLKQNPFALTPDPACFFPNPHHEDALATLIDSLHKHQGMGALLGAAGLGKTLLLHVYLRLAQQRQYKTIYVAETDLAFRTLLQVLYEAWDSISPPQRWTCCVPHVSSTRSFSALMTLI